MEFKTVNPFMNTSFEGDLGCGYCKTASHNPMQIKKCGHTFCSKCVDDLAINTLGFLSCHTCHEPFSPNDIQVDFNNYNFYFNVLKLNLPDEVVQHPAFYKECLKFPSQDATKENADQILSRAYNKSRKVDPNLCLYLLRPSTTRRETDDVKIFTIAFAYKPSQGKPCIDNYRLGFKSGEWVSYDLEDKISIVKPTLDDLIRALSLGKGNVRPYSRVP
ncbi:MAG: hypothetical protein JSR46_03835 [Verrucomicrobia bacterium]|nr:hypothetical protein [Verrucomicrobiota bacterium]